MARYRRGPRNMLLHAAIVAVTAATTSLWLARAQAGYVERAFPRLDGLASAKAHVHLPRPTRPITVPAFSSSFSEKTEDPPSVVVSAPDVAPPPAPAASQVEPAAPVPESGQPAVSEPAEAAPSAEPAQEQPAPVRAPAAVAALAVSTAYLRTQPTNDALISRTLPAGSLVTVLGCSAGCSWLLVQTSDGYQAWSASVWYSVQGTLTAQPAR